MPHEIVDGFRGEGLRLRRTLEEMLDEHAVHRTDRRGCGYTQATRFLATYVNQPGAAADPADLDVFEDWPTRDTGFAAAMLLGAGWPHGWRRTDELSDANRAGAAQYVELLEALSGLRSRIHRIAGSCALPESRLLASLLWQLLARDGRAPHSLPPMPMKPQIGSCSQAEEFFLELAHGRVRRGGSVNVFTDAAGQPLLLEKMNLGESHSAIVLESVRLNGVDLPPGSLCALAHVPDASARSSAHGRRLSLAGIAEARFLRLTTLAVEPSERRRAFSAQLAAQVRAGMLSPTTTTLAELRAFARAEVEGAA